MGFSNTDILRQPGNLVQSGIDTVAVECVHAIIGAIALSRGGLEAKKFVTRLIQQRNISA